jgi:asparagine synthase (glutamine-hydrolysing)
MVEKLKHFTTDLLSEERLKKHGLLNKTAVKDTLNRFYSGDRQYAGKIWNLMMFQVWWENYFG